MKPSRDLYRDDDLVVRLVPRGKERIWVVTFDSHSSDHSLDRPGFGEQFLSNHRISAAHILGRGNHWYHYPGMAAALALLKAHLAPARRVITYGSSMGGYAALRFADAVGAKGALALSPQYSIDPARMPEEKRWSQESASIAWRPELEGPITPVPQMVIAFDPRDFDRHHVDRIAAEAPVETVALPHVGHPVTTFFGVHRLLQPMVLDMARGQLDLDAVRAQAASLRRTSPVYLSELARGQPACRSRTAIALARRALAVAPGQALYQHILARRLSAAGEHAEALALHHAAVSRPNRHLAFVHGNAEGLLAAGQAAAARILTEELLAKEPEAANFHGLHAKVLEALGDRAGARAAAATAARLNPAFNKPRLMPGSGMKRLVDLARGTLRTRVGRFINP